MSEETIKEKQTVADLVMNGLMVDGEHHKQWYLEQIAKLIGIDLIEPLNFTEGIPP